MPLINILLLKKVVTMADLRYSALLAIRSFTRILPISSVIIYFYTMLQTIKMGEGLKEL